MGRICISRSIAVVVVGSGECLCVYTDGVPHRQKGRKNKDERWGLQEGAGKEREMLVS